MSVFDIEVVFALPDKQSLIPLSVPAGTTAKEAVVLSGLADIYKQIDLENLSLGIYGRSVAEDVVIENHDRVEIYRPLVIDPMELRRKKALIAQKKKDSENVAD